MKKNKIIGLLTLSILLLGSITAQQLPSLTDTISRNRKLVLEEFTGIRCTYCPNGHKIAADILKQYPDESFALLFHQGQLSGPVGADDLDLRTPYGDALYQQSGPMAGWPSGNLNRHILPGFTEMSIPYSDWSKYVINIINLPSYVNVGAKGSIDWKSREVKIDVELYYTGTPQVATNSLNLILLQDNIICAQVGMNSNPSQITEDGLYRHMHAVRDLITGQWGETIEGIAKGTLIKKSYTYTLPEMIKDVPVDLNNIYFVATVAEGKAEVLTACKAEMTNLNAPEYNVQFESASQIEQVDCSGETKAMLKLNNRSAAKVENITIEIASKAATEEQTIDLTDFPANSIKEITTEAFAIPLNEKSDVSFTIKKVNGVDYTYTYNKTIKKNMIVWGGHTASSTVDLNIVQDRWGSEIKWTLKTIEGEDVAKGGPYKDLDAVNTKENLSKLTLNKEGCYIFNVTDEKEDGINSNFGKGYIEIKNPDGNVIAKHDGKYKASGWIFIKRGKVSNENNSSLTSNFYIQPNPVSDGNVNLMFSMPTAENVQIYIRDLAGRLVKPAFLYAANIGANSISLSLNSIKPGMYIVSIQNANGKSSTQKLIIK